MPSTNNQEKTSEHIVTLNIYAMTYLYHYHKHFLYMTGHIIICLNIHDLHKLRKVCPAER